MAVKDVRTYLQHVEATCGHVPAMTAHALLVEDDEWVMELIDMTLDQKLSKADRADSLCRLLGTYGVGTIVAGRLV